MGERAAAFRRSRFSGLPSRLAAALDVFSLLPRAVRAPEWLLPGVRVPGAVQPEYWQYPNFPPIRQLSWPRLQTAAYFSSPIGP